MEGKFPSQMNEAPLSPIEDIWCYCVDDDPFLGPDGD